MVGKCRLLRKTGLTFETSGGLEKLCRRQVVRLGRGPALKGCQRGRDVDGLEGLGAQRKFGLGALAAFEVQGYCGGQPFVSVMKGLRDR